MPNEINEKTRIPLVMAISLVAIIASGVAGYSGTLKAIDSKIDDRQAREIAREEIRAANVANGTDLAVLVQRVAAVENQVKALADEQRESNKLLRQLVQP